MTSPNEDFTRRKVLASSASLATVGTVISGSASAAEDGEEQSVAESFGVQELTDAITIENGKARVKETARNSETPQISVTTSSGESVTYTASDFAEDINRGVEQDYWAVTETNGELDFTLGDKFLALVEEHERNRNPFQALGCGGKNTIEDGVYYFDSDSLDELVDGFEYGGGLLSIAGIIIGLISAATYGPAVLAVAGILVGLGGGELNEISDGCGIKVDPNAANEVQPQDCNC